MSVLNIKVGFLMKRHVIARIVMPLVLVSTSLMGKEDSLGVQQISKVVANETREGVGIGSQPFFMVNLANGDSLTVVITQDSQPSQVKELHLSAVNVRNHQLLQIPWSEIIAVQRFDPRNVRALTNSIAGIHSEHLSPCTTPGLCDESCAHACYSSEAVLGIVLSSSYLDDGFASSVVSSDAVAEMARIDMELLIDEIAFEACLDVVPSNWLAFDEAYVPNGIVFDLEIFDTVGVDPRQELNDYHVGQLIKKIDQKERSEAAAAEFVDFAHLLAVDDFEMGSDSEDLEDAGEETTEEYVFLASAKKPGERLLALHDETSREISPAFFKEIAALLLEEDHDPTFMKQKIRLEPFFFIGDEMIDHAAYEKFIKATGYPAPADWPNGHMPEGSAKEGMKNLSWEDAQAFILWTEWT